jgi:hypothetical protein
MTGLSEILTNDYKQVITAIEAVETNVSDYNLEHHEELELLLEFVEIQRSLTLAIDHIKCHIHARYQSKEAEGDALLKQLELNTDKDAEHWMAVISGQKEPDERGL